MACFYEHRTRFEALRRWCWSLGLRCKQYIPPRCWYAPTSSHSVTAQKRTSALQLTFAFCERRELISWATRAPCCSSRISFNAFFHSPLTYLYLPNLRAEYPLRSSMLSSRLVRGDGRSREMASHMSTPSIPFSCDTSPPARTAGCVVIRCHALDGQLWAG